MQRILITIFLPVLLLTVVAFVLPTGADGFKVRTNHRPAVTWTGSYSDIQKREFHRITNNDDWLALWMRHASENAERDSYGDVVVPAIDFEHFMIVAHFRGKAWNTRSEKLIEYVEYDTHIQMKFDGNTYQTAAIVIEPSDVTPGSSRLTAKAADANDDPNHTSSYAMWVMPRSTKSITVEENVQGLIGRPPKWKVQHTFKEIGTNGN